jgi:hypothetical protein
VANIRCPDGDGFDGEGEKCRSARVVSQMPAVWRTGFSPQRPSKGQARCQPSWTERQSTAAKARQAQLEKARAKAPANDPEFAQRQTARRAAAEARDARTAERKAAKVRQAEDLIAETAARERAAETERAHQITESTRAMERELAEKAERAAAREVELAKQKERNLANESERKAARDLRYAARKARKK